MEKVIDKGIEIDSNYGLLQVFNYINQDQKSLVFVYEGVQFWRQDFQFIMSYNEKPFIAGDILDYDEFIQLLKDQREACAPNHSANPGE